MRDLIKRCDEIIERIEKMKDARDPKDYQLVGSIQTIYTHIFNSKIPDEYSFEGWKRRAHNYQDEYLSYYFIFKGFVEELKHGFVNTLENLATLNVYGSMLDEARRLRKENDKNLNRAAVMFGRVVLEDTLRKLCDQHSVTYDPKFDKASKLNQNLWKDAQIYSQQEWRKNDAWLDLGNKAAHPDPEFDKIPVTEIDSMLDGIEQFAQNYLKRT